MAQLIVIHFYSIIKWIFLIISHQLQTRWTKESLRALGPWLRCSRYRKQDWHHINSSAPHRYTDFQLCFFEFASRDGFRRNVTCSPNPIQINLKTQEEKIYYFLCEKNIIIKNWFGFHFKWLRSVPPSHSLALVWLKCVFEREFPIPVCLPAFVFFFFTGIFRNYQRYQNVADVKPKSVQNSRWVMQFSTRIRYESFECQHFRFLFILFMMITIL